MPLYYDLHIHSALSPCGDDDMTPNNIINMAVLKGLDIIAVTDHNSTFNLPALYEVAKSNGIFLLPGIEVQTKEEVHVLCYFKKIENAMEFGEAIYRLLPDTPNNPNLFGHQYIMDSNDSITGCADKLLLSSADISINQLSELSSSYEGCAIPAHIDRTSYSIISNLGFIPDMLNISTVEISRSCSMESALSMFPYIKKMNILRSSDAHYLWDISERENCLPIDEVSISKIFSFFCGCV